MILILLLKINCYFGFYRDQQAEPSFGVGGPFAMTPAEATATSMMAASNPSALSQREDIMD